MNTAILHRGNHIRPAQLRAHTGSVPLSPLPTSNPKNTQDDSRSRDNDSQRGHATLLFHRPGRPLRAECDGGARPCTIPGISRCGPRLAAAEMKSLRAPRAFASVLIFSKSTCSMPIVEGSIAVPGFSPDPQFRRFEWEINEKS